MRPPASIRPTTTPGPRPLLSAAPLALTENVWPARLQLFTTTRACPVRHGLLGALAFLVLFFFISDLNSGPDLLPKQL